LIRLSSSIPRRSHCSQHATLFIFAKTGSNSFSSAVGLSNLASRMNVTVLFLIDHDLLKLILGKPPRINDGRAIDFWSSCRATLQPTAPPLGDAAVNVAHAILLSTIAADSGLKSDLIFPRHPKHNHSSCIVECPNGDLLVCWYRRTLRRRRGDPCRPQSQWRR
jgi:hypothetical protein